MVVSPNRHGQLHGGCRLVMNREANYWLHGYSREATTWSSSGAFCVLSVWSWNTQNKHPVRTGREPGTFWLKAVCPADSGCFLVLECWFVVEMLRWSHLWQLLCLLRTLLSFPSCPVLSFRVDWWRGWHWGMTIREREEFCICPSVCCRVT